MYPVLFYAFADPMNRAGDVVFHLFVHVVHGKVVGLASILDRGQFF